MSNFLSSHLIVFIDSPLSSTELACNKSQDSHMTYQLTSAAAVGSTAAADSTLSMKNSLRSSLSSPCSIHAESCL